MMKRVIILTTLLALGVCGIQAPSYSGPIKDSHKVMIAGIVVCNEDGEIRPEKGATVTITTIYDMAGGDSYDLPRPQTTTTDGNGIWVLSFDVPYFSPLTMPGGFEGEIITPCKSGKIRIVGRLEQFANPAACVGGISANASSAAQLVKNAMVNVTNLKGLVGPMTIELVVYGAYTYTEVTCSKKKPIIDKPGREDDVTRGPAATPTPPAPPPIGEERTPPTTPSRPREPPWPPIPEEPHPDLDAYARCVKKCQEILKKLKPLEDELRRLEARESDKTEKARKEFERLKDLYARNEASLRQQKYITPDGTEHWGRADIAKSYKKHGYQPVEGSYRIPPDSQRYLNMIKDKIAAAEEKYRKAKEENSKNKEKERKRIKDAMNKIREEYNACIRSCDKYKEIPGGIKVGANIIDFIPRTGSRPDVSRGPQPQPPPVQGDASGTGQTALLPEGDAATGSQGMPIEEPRPLEATEGFDVEPPLDTYNYATTVVPLGTEEVQYKNLKQNRVTYDTAALYKPTPEGMEITASTVATGKGADFRKWKISDVRMNIDGDVVKPSGQSDFYIEKDSYYREAAAVAFAAIGSQYRSYASQAESGEVCPVTGQKKESGERKDTIADGVDRAGMAAGLGLLASQARGSIPAKKATFRLDKEQTQKVLAKKGELQVTAKNETAHQEETVKIPLR